MGRVHPVRNALAALASVIPAVAIAVTYSAWRGGLGADVAFHWDAAGRVDGVIPTGAVFWLAQVIAIFSGGVGAIVSLSGRVSARTKRSSVTWAGFFSGLALALWLVPAGVTYRAGSAEGAHLDGWLALLAAFLLYGIVVRAFVPRDDAAAPSS